MPTKVSHETYQEITIGVCIMIHVSANYHWDKMTSGVSCF